MFFFFFGGVRQQVSEILRRDAGRCFRCGEPADAVRYDNVLQIFFLPVWRWPSKNTALHCNSCGSLFPHSWREELPDQKTFSESSSLPAPSHCWSCSGPLQPSFKFCPQCGARQGF